jgi:hypothetical protein
MEDWLVGKVGWKRHIIGMEEASENGKELLNSARAKGMNEYV